MSSEIALAKLDEAAANGCQLTRSLKATFSGALTVARVAQQIRLALTPELVQEVLMPLMETDFGWRTDGKKYTLEQIRDAWVDAALKGAVPVNNEVTLISGRAYLNKNYFSRMIRELPGMTDFVAIPGKLIMLPNGSALVEYSATWKLNGKAMQLLRTKDSAIPVRLNNGQGADAALGKAERKFKSGVFSMITGSTFEDDDFDVEDLRPVAVVTERKEPAMPQNVLPEPTAAKAGTTQTKATTEKIKKIAAEKKPEPPPTPEPEQQSAPEQQQEQGEAAGDETPPWATGDEGDQQTEQQSEPAPQQAALPATETKPPEDTKVVGWVKNNATGQMEEVRKPTKKKPDAAPAATTTVPPTAKAEAPPSNAGSGEIETDHPGKIVKVTANDKQRNPPYRVACENATVYRSQQVSVAEKASSLSKQNVPVEIDYTKDEAGELWIVDIRPEGQNETANEM